MHCSSIKIISGWFGMRKHIPDYLAPQAGQKPKVDLTSLKIECVEYSVAKYY